MRSSSIVSRQRRHQRSRGAHGMSVVEFIGCLSAMVGGVVLGSMYLGVDVRSMGLAVLKQAQLVNSDKDSENHVKPASEQGDTSIVAAQAPKTIGTVAEPVETTGTPKVETAFHHPPGDPTDSRSGAPEDAAKVPQAASSSSPLIELPPSEELISLTDEQRQTLTKVYWKALDECMKTEVKNRTASIREDGNWQLFDYLTCRKAGHEQATANLRSLNLRGVDAHVAAYAETALAWHQDGVKLFSRALDLLTDAPTAQLSGPFAQSWQSAATQHQMEERLVREKHQAVQAYLDHSHPVNDAPAKPPAVAPAPAK